MMGIILDNYYLSHSVSHKSQAARDVFDKDLTKCCAAVLFTGSLISQNVKRHAVDSMQEIGFYHVSQKTAPF